MSLRQQKTNSGQIETETKTTMRNDRHRFLTLLTAMVAAVVLMTALPASAQTQAQPGNPLLQPSQLPFQATPFDKIKDGDFAPAFDQGIKEQLAEVEQIANNPAAPTFDNTLVA